MEGEINFESVDLSQVGDKFKSPRNDTEEFFVVKYQAIQFVYS